MSELRTKLCEVRENLRFQTRGIIMQYENENLRTDVSNNFKTIGTNVDIILCSLDSNDMTVVNVKFNKGGEIPIHNHDRVEHIYVIEGSITDKLNNKTFKKGEVYEIPPHQNHHIVSDFALLVVTWTPAYESDSI